MERSTDNADCGRSATAVIDAPVYVAPDRLSLTEAAKLAIEQAPPPVRRGGVRTATFIWRGDKYGCWFPADAGRTRRKIGCMPANW